MNAWATSLGTRTRRSIEEEPSIAPDTDQDADRVSVLELRQADRIVPAIEDEERRCASCGKQIHNVLNLFVGYLVYCPAGSDSTHIERCSPAAADGSKLGNPGVRPARDDRFPGTVTTRMVEVAPLWTGLGIVSDPGRGIDGKDEWIVVIQGGADQCSNTLGTERALSQCCVQAAMTTLEGSLKTEVREAGHQSRNGDGVKEVEQRI